VSALQPYLIELILWEQGGALLPERHATNPIRSGATVPASVRPSGLREVRANLGVRLCLLREDRGPIMLANYFTPSARRVDRSRSNDDARGAGSRSLRRDCRPLQLSDVAVDRCITEAQKAARTRAQTPSTGANEASNAPRS
jgi:hypothetical protein